MKKDLLPTIRYLRDVQQLSFRQIEEKTGIARKKCSKIYIGSYQEPAARQRVLDAYYDLIRQWYQENNTLTAQQIYDKLRARGLEVSYPSVSLYTREFRKKKQKCFWEMTFLPGEESQVDWFFVNHPRLGKLSGFALLLSHSRYLFCHFFRRHSFEFFIEGHLMAFLALGGTTRSLRYDNLKSVVLSLKPPKYNPAFLEFATYYGFDIRLCNPRAGNEKGRVERVIRTIRGSFLNLALHHQSLKALNLALHQWVTEKNNSKHRGSHRIPSQHRLEESLKPLPERPWHNVTVHPSKPTTKTGMVLFDTNAYSVPEYACGKNLTVHSSCDRIEIFDAKGNRVASHQRRLDRNNRVVSPQHRTFNKLSKQAKAERIYAVIRGMDPQIERFLCCQAKEEPYYRAYRIFKLLGRHSKSVLLSAIRDALKHNTSIAYLESLLASCRERGDEDVQPQNKQILNITYKPRSLEEYE